MAGDKPEDLSLPLTVISRIIDEAIPPNTSVSVEVRKVLSKAASIFVLYTSATAGSIMSKNSRKTMNANDVIEAMQEMEFPMFVEPLKESLQHFREIQQKKKESTATRKSEEASNASTSISTPSSSSSVRTPQLKENAKQEPPSTSAVVILSSDSD